MKSIDVDQLPVILKRARQALDLSQADVAKRLGISQRAYAFYEDEERTKTPKPQRLADLGRILNIPIKSLLKYYDQEIEENSSETDTREVDVNKSLDPPDERLLNQIEARRRDYEKWAELARADKERAEKEKDRLLNVIDNNMALLIKLVGEVYASSNSMADDISALTTEVQAEHRAMMDTLDKAAKQPIGTTRAAAGTVELASHEARAKKGRKAEAGK